MLKRFGCALILAIGVLSQPSAWAQGTPPKTMKVQLSLGVGWHLCAIKKNLPPIENAFLCPGLLPSLRNIELELQSQNAAKPNWLFYSASHVASVTFEDIESKVELMVAYAKYDGKTYAFIDGRITSKRQGANLIDGIPVYFRLTGEGGFDYLQGSTVYGGAIVYQDEDGNKMNFAPIVSVSRKQ